MLLDRIAEGQAEAMARFSRARVASIEAGAALEIEQTKQRQEAQKQLQEALYGLGVDLGGITDGINSVEQAAINKFQRVTLVLKQAGLSAEQNAKVVQQAYTAAFEDLENKAARVKLQDIGNEIVAQGVISAQQLSAAWQQAAVASDLAEKAIQKRTAALQAQQTQEQAEFGLRERLIQLSLSENQAAQDLARAKGDEAEAGRLLVEQKRLEAQLSELRADALRAESEAELAQIAAIREELTATNSLTEAKKAELAARTAAAKAKEIEAQISDVVANKQRALIQLNYELAASNREVEGAARSAGAAGQQMGSSIYAGTQQAAQGLSALSRGFGDFYNTLSQDYGGVAAKAFQSISAQTDLYGNPNIYGAQQEVRQRIQRAQEEYRAAQTVTDPDDRYRELKNVNKNYLTRQERQSLESALQSAKEAKKQAAQAEAEAARATAATQPARVAAEVVELRLKTDSGKQASVEVEKSQVDSLLSLLESAGVRSV